MTPCTFCGTATQGNVGNVPCCFPCYESGRPFQQKPQMKNCIIDIRTAARPEKEILHMAPEFKAPSNYKDADKIAAHIATQKTEWLDKAAVSALTGRVLMAGIRQDGQTTLAEDTDDEKTFISRLWMIIENCVRAQRVVVGFDLARQKLPFLIRRSWALGLDVPYDGPMNNTLFIDLLESWRCGDKHEYISLHALARFLGATFPNGGNSPTPAFANSRTMAAASLTADLLLTEQIMHRMIPGTEAGAAAQTSPPAAVLPTAVVSHAGQPEPAGGGGGAETLSLTIDDY